MRIVNWRLERERGQDLAEYAMIIALLAVGLMLIIGSIVGGLGNALLATRNALVNLPQLPLPL
ncbi:MAG: Flp family type IVb pilin [Anaerolineae bacterium]